jgi:hypothetical protein
VRNGHGQDPEVSQLARASCSGVIPLGQPAPARSRCELGRVAGGAGRKELEPCSNGRGLRGEVAPARERSRLPRFPNAPPEPGADACSVIQGLAVARVARTADDIAQHDVPPWGPAFRVVETLAVAAVLEPAARFGRVFRVAVVARFEVLAALNRKGTTDDAGLDGDLGDDERELLVRPNAGSKKSWYETSRSRPTSSSPRHSTFRKRITWRSSGFEKSPPNGCRPHARPDPLPGVQHRGACPLKSRLQHLQDDCLPSRPWAPNQPRNRDHSEERVVPEGGVEPPPPCGDMDLTHARLPIPPPGQVVRRGRRRIGGQSRVRDPAARSARGANPIERGANDTEWAWGGQRRAGDNLRIERRLGSLAWEPCAGRRARAERAPLGRHGIRPPGGRAHA